MTAITSNFNDYKAIMCSGEMEMRRLTSLVEVNRLLSDAPRLGPALHKVLETLITHHGVIRAAVTLLRPDEAELRIEASVGLGPNGNGTRYRLGEGITGRVVESGKAIVVPKISDEPLFLHRAVQRISRPDSEITFLCIPIFINRKPAGSLNIDIHYTPERDYEQALKFFGLVASMIGQAVKVNRLVDAERNRLLEENVHLRDQLKDRYDFSNLIGTSGPMREVYQKVMQVAPTNTTVMIRGESGTGKELIANAIHYNSLRKNRAFVKVNCAALPETLIESELFGHEKGAFTGAQAQKKGRFEIADRGTLFLDEIGELSAATAVKLLRVLQEREFERVGGTAPLKVDVRLIVATNKDLEKAISDGSFREDLYYRLNVFTIFLPPLRERKPDILLLADHFLEKYRNEQGKDIRRISTPAIDMLMSYHWPGNVRELENIIQRAVLVCDSNVIHGHHLPPTLQTAEASGTTMQISFQEAVEAYEKDLIMDTLKTTKGNRSKAASLLKTTERVISYKAKKYHIDCDRFKLQTSAGKNRA